MNLTGKLTFNGNLKAYVALEPCDMRTHVRKNEVDAIPLTPPLAPGLLPGSVLTPSLGAYLLTQKFCYHRTFYVSGVRSALRR